MQINTGNLYNDGSVRPSVVYVAAADVRTHSVPPPQGGDVEEAIAQRDMEWREAIIDAVAPEGGAG